LSPKAVLAGAADAALSLSSPLMHWPIPYRWQLALAVLLVRLVRLAAQVAMVVLAATRPSAVTWPLTAAAAVRAGKLRQRLRVAAGAADATRRAVLVLVLRLALAGYQRALDRALVVKALPAVPPLADHHTTAGKAAVGVAGQQTPRLALLVAGPFGAAAAVVLVGIVMPRPQLSEPLRAAATVRA
jgi:hypothetical protein